MCKCIELRLERFPQKAIMCKLKKCLQSSVEARPVSSVHSSQCRQVSPPPPPQKKTAQNWLSFLLGVISGCASEIQMWIYVIFHSKSLPSRISEYLSTGERMYVYGKWFNVSSCHWYISLSIFQLVNNAIEIDAPTNETIYNGCS